MANLNKHKARPGKLLYVDLVPQSCFFKNIRSEVSDSEWKQLKTASYKAAGYCCEICAGKGPAHPVECHERWSFDDITGVQTLTKLESLCPDCHTSTHIGQAELRGLLQEAFDHLAYVNSWTDIKTQQHIDEAFKVWRYRSMRPWDFDMSLLAEIGVKLSTESLSKLIIKSKDRLMKIPTAPDVPIREGLLNSINKQLALFNIADNGGEVMVTSKKLGAENL